MQFGQLKRREFITLLGGAVAAWPYAARAQQRERVRRIGVLNTFAAEDPEGQARIAALLQALQPLGWTVGTNLRIDHRWGTGDAATTRKNAAELVALAPDVILTSGAAGVGPLLEATRSVRLLSYGNDQIDNYRRAASYADRILKGAKPSELPVQAPVKFNLVINLKTAKALGIDVPAQLQQRADEVIE
jgi:ABC-type uncharacterized transport system substrate-binding protein